MNITKLENTCKQTVYTRINTRKSKVNLMNLARGLELLLQIKIKLPDKDSIIVVMIPMDYWNRCYRYLSDTAFYNNPDNNDPSTTVQDRINKSAEKYKSILTNNEYDFPTKGCHKISNFYALPKLHKSKETNEITEIKRPIVAGPVFHTGRISKILHYIMEPALSSIPYIVLDSFDFTQ